MNIDKNTVIAALRFAQRNELAFREFASKGRFGPIFNGTGIDTLVEHTTGKEAQVLIEVRKGSVAGAYARFGTRVIVFDHDEQPDHRRAEEVAADMGLSEAAMESGPVRNYRKIATAAPGSRRVGKRAA